MIPFGHIENLKSETISGLGAGVGKKCPEWPDEHQLVVAEELTIRCLSFSWMGTAQSLVDT